LRNCTTPAASRRLPRSAWINPTRVTATLCGCAQGSVLDYGCTDKQTKMDLSDNHARGSNRELCNSVNHLFISLPH
jgi:hypothetical protein